MKNIVCLLMLILSYAIIAKEITSSNVSGNWIISESPYKIKCDITISNNQLLTIEPGVEIIFMGHYMLNVQGQIEALGNYDNKIYFHSKNKDEGWLGIRFIKTSIKNSKSIIKYCIFEDGNANIFENGSNSFIGGAIYLENYSKVLISNNLFQNNKAGVGSAIGCNNSSPDIIYNHFKNNCAGSKTHSGYATIECRYRSSPLIVKNIIENNCVFGANYAAGAGIRLVANCDARIIENTIRYNYIISKGNLSEGAGLYIHSSNPVLVDNLIYGNYILPYTK